MTKKAFKGQAHVDYLAKQVIGKLMTFMELEDTSAADCQAAMGINNNDFEDAMLMACAARETMDYIVTRNIAHFKSSSVPVVTPADFVKLLNRSNGT
jgi:hypothetical protein